MYKLIITADSKSRAKLLGKKVNNYIVGQEYEVKFTIENIGDVSSPRGYCGIEITYPESKFKTQLEVHFPTISPDKSDTSGPYIYNVLSGGLANFTATRRQSHESSEKLLFYRDDGKSIKPLGESFHSIYCEHPEAVYEYWALITAAISLGIIALEKMWNIIELIINWIY